PEYAHNIPAALKNALEWLVAGGELSGKPVLAVTYTPHAPRGEDAMQSLCATLSALDMRVVAQLPLYRNEVMVEADGQLSGSGLELVEAGMELLAAG
ncbi:MAG: NAD(P)H-dependent oxidoreductase, partial [Saprospiraceae bacterium]